MLHKMLNRLLAMHFKKSHKNANLERLESDVLCKIHTIKADLAMPWYDKMMIAFSVPRFRLASLVIALIIGVVASPVFMPSTIIASNSDIPSMNVFTLQATYLPTNLFERIE